MDLVARGVFTHSANIAIQMDGSTLLALLRDGRAQSATRNCGATNIQISASIAGRNLSGQKRRLDMTMCDSCMVPKPRRVVKVKDLLYGKSFTEYNLCENCFRKLFKELDQNKAKMGGMK